MGVIGRYFSRLKALATGQGGRGVFLNALAGGITIGHESVHWSDIRALSAFRRDVYLHDLMCMAIETTSGRLIEMNEQMPGWPKVCDAIDRHLPGAVPREEWIARLLASPDGAVVRIYTAP